ncbi:MAG: hypothetical protein ACRDTH_04885 [Pseudonocardiaceae bacterium]
MSGTPSARAIARLLMVGAVLAGVFLMHDLPAQACPGGTGMPASSMTATPALTAHSGEPTQVAAAAHGEMAHALPAAHATTTGHGSVCVSTPPPRSHDGLLTLLLAAGALASPARLLHVDSQRGRASRRAPPPTESELLTTLCVSRT